MQYLLTFLVPKVCAQAPQSLIPASGSLGEGCDIFTGRLTFHCIPLYIGYLVQLLLALAGGFFLFGMMMAGYKYMFGSVSQAGMEAGKKEIIARIVGFVIIVFAYMFVDTIVQLLT